MLACQLALNITALRPAHRESSSPLSRAISASASRPLAVLHELATKPVRAVAAGGEGQVELGTELQPLRKRRPRLRRVNESAHQRVDAPSMPRNTTSAALM